MRDLVTDSVLATHINIAGVRVALAIGLRGFLLAVIDRRGRQYQISIGRTR